MRINIKRFLAASLRSGLVIFFAFTAPVELLAADTDKTPHQPIWLAVTRPMFVESLEPLVKHRQSDGFETVVSTKPISDAIAACPRKPAFILLVGDDAPDSKKAPWYLPAKRKKFYRWIADQKKTYASDMAWGDLDADSIPDVPVGRLPVRTIEQVENVIAKLIEYDGSTDMGGKCRIRPRF